MIGTVRDERDERTTKFGYVVFKDTFLSNWGVAEGGRSLYALRVDSPEEACIVLQNGAHRSEMKSGKLIQCPGASWPRVFGRAKDHLSIVDKTIARRWYEPGAFVR